jgi:hypothetical protein
MREVGREGQSLSAHRMKVTRLRRAEAKTQIVVETVEVGTAERCSEDVRHVTFEADMLHGEFAS